WSKAVGDRMAEEIVPAGGKLLEKASHFAVGIRADEFAGGIFVADSPDEAAARTTVASIEAIGAFARPATAAALKANPSEGQRRGLRLAADVFEKRPVRRDGTQVRAEGASRIELAKLVKDFFSPAMQDEK